MTLVIATSSLLSEVGLPHAAIMHTHRSAATQPTRTMDILLCTLMLSNAASPCDAIGNATLGRKLLHTRGDEVLHAHRGGTRAKGGSKGRQLNLSASIITTFKFCLILGFPTPRKDLPRGSKRNSSKIVGIAERTNVHAQATVLAASRHTHLTEVKQIGKMRCSSLHCTAKVNKTPQQVLWKDPNRHV